VINLYQQFEKAEKKTMIQVKGPFYQKYEFALILQRLQ